MKQLVKAVLIFAVIAAGVSYASAEEQLSLFKRKFYFGYFIPNNTYEGKKFDGNYYFENDREFILFPKIESGNGWGLLLGTALDKKDRFSLDISYSQSNQIGRINPDTRNSYTGSVFIESWNADLKVNLMPNKKVQPYVQIGAVFPNITLHSLNYYYTDTDWYSFKVRDAVLNGVGYNLGMGINTYINNSVLFTFGLVYHKETFGSVKGVYGSYPIDNLETDGINLNLGVKYNFYIWE